MRAIAAAPAEDLEAVQAEVAGWIADAAPASLRRLTDRSDDGIMARGG